MKGLKSIRSRHSRRSGMVTLWVYMTLFLMLAFVGFASDGGWVYLVGHQLQNAADAGALAGALQVQTSTATAVTHATTTAQANKAGGALVQLAANPTNDPGGDVVIGFYDRSSGTFTATLSSPNAVKVVTRRTSSSPGGALPLHFAALAGFSSSNVTRYAIAMIGGTIGAGVIALDKTANPAIQLTGTGNNSNKIVVSATAGAVVIDSTSSTALQWTGNPYITAADLYIGGNDTAVVGSGVFPSGHLGLNNPYEPDPLASLPVPPKGTTQAGTGPNLLPGYYPNGLPTGKNFVLAAGIYYVDGGITMKGGDSIDATAGCMIYLHTGGITETGTPNITIQPPTSGTYQGISFYEDRSNTSSITLKGTSGSSGGTYYFPAAHVSIQGTPTALCSQLICDTLDVQGNAQLNVNYNGNFPLPGHEVFLVK